GHNITIVAKKEDETDRNKARTNVENVLNAYSDINLVFGLGDRRAVVRPEAADVVDVAAGVDDVLVVGAGLVAIGLIFLLGDDRDVVALDRVLDAGEALGGVVGGERADEDGHLAAIRQ